MTRKGITPVVAVVLLLMMTVAAAGGAYTWVTGIVERGQEEGQASLNRDVRIQDLTCNTGGSVDYFLSNSGSTTVDASSVTVYQYNVSTGSLMTTGSINHGTMAPGTNTGQSSVSLNAMTSGYEYRVEFEFSNEDGYSVSGTCQAQ